ncbi:hypothetical protein GA0070606_6321 [Micromonospora citrea]|uniref:Uncharacterized protein n=1 Tax=Micromonospora citrea TaxID=47855 RepID=A0A1C6W2V4_9ACTN|nr:hypothetical protein [Micromonospora citrea]SCL72842.1 hypothetical protein GA0070606_6321 [Micromonospora citrea]
MRAGAARAVAAAWVRRYAARTPGVEGALLSGSVLGMAADAVLPPWSDVDVLVVRAEPAEKLGKFRWGGVLLEVSFVTWEELGSAEDVLGSWVFAGCLRGDGVLADPTGRLAGLRARVSAEFADRVWVRRRLAGLRARVEAGLRGLPVSGPLHEQVTAWLFPTSLTAVLPLVAGLVEPTVRRRYVVAREVLAAYGMADRYAEMLGLLDGGGVSAGRVAEHLAGLARTFDVAAGVARTRFAFSADITAVARPVVVDGGAALVASGSHREAMFWVVATYARCHAVLAVDAPGWGVELAPSFEAAVADLGVLSAAERRRRADEVLAFLPGWCAAVERIAAR